MSTPHASPENPTTSFSDLCRRLPELDVPEDWKGELFGGRLVLSPYHRPRDFFVMAGLEKQLQPHLPQGHLVAGRPFLFGFPEQERAFLPDIYVADERAFHTTGYLVDGQSLTLAAELTSPSTSRTDWGDKLRVYGHAGVPVYLVLHMADATATVFWQPTPEGYAERKTVPFGEKLHAPAPFDFELDTTGLGDGPEDAPKSE